MSDVEVIQPGDPHVVIMVCLHDTSHRTEGQDSAVPSDRNRTRRDYFMIAYNRGRCRSLY